MLDYKISSVLLAPKHVGLTLTVVGLRDKTFDKLLFPCVLFDRLALKDCIAVYHSVCVTNRLNPDFPDRCRHLELETEFVFTIIRTAGNLMTPGAKRGDYGSFVN